MRNLFLSILFFGLFFGAQIVYFENSLNKNVQIDFEDISQSIVSIESVPNTLQKKFGSGVIISSDGYIVTAFHILSGSLSTVKIDEKAYIANLIGFDEYADLAVLKINEDNLSNLGQILKKHIDDLKEATEHMLSILNNGELSEASGAATPYLKIFGQVLGGYYMGLSLIHI